MAKNKSLAAKTAKSRAQASAAAVYAADLDVSLQYRFGELVNRYTVPSYDGIFRRRFPHYWTVTTIDGGADVSTGDGRYWYALRPTDGGRWAVSAYDGNNIIRTFYVPGIYQAIDRAIAIDRIICPDAVEVMKKYANYNT